MASLKICLLGPPQVELDGEAVSIKPRKALALLAYLAGRGQPQTRDALATLFWPDSSQRQARAALRRRLSELRRTPVGEWLEIDRETVALGRDDDSWLDVAAFRGRLAACETHGHAADTVCQRCIESLRAAVELYRADFLAGFSLPDCRDFDAWQFFEMEDLRQGLGTALARLVRWYSEAEEPGAALPYARRQLALDPLQEGTHRQLMTLYARTGQLAAALRQYEHCVEVLETELGTPPEAETKTLYERIRGGTLAGPAAEPISVAPAAPTPPVEDELRLVTVLFADMSRSVALTWDLQPDQTADLVNRLLERMLVILEQYGARVDRLLGDGLLAVFGAPQGHEDDAARAIEAARAIRDAARGLGLGVTAGLNTGLVYFGRMGRANHQEVTVMGPVVNLAARLQGQAEEGQILVGERTFRQARGAFRFDQHMLTIKGVPGPVPVYEVIRPRQMFEKVRGIEGLRAALVGRDMELARLKEALARAQNGRGQVVLLSGEAGVGKSRLVAELKERALSGDGESGRQWLAGHGLEMTERTAYGPFVDLLRRYFGFEPGDDGAMRAERVVNRLQALVAAENLTPARGDEMGPLLGNLLSLRFGTDWDQRLKNTGPEQIRYQTFEALTDFCLALARRQPLVLVLEDLHWADSLTLDLVSRLLDELSAVPLMLICVYRPERDHKCWRLSTIAGRKCPDRLTEIRLRSLTPAQSRELVEALLAVEELSEAVKEAILARSQGNPFFLEEVVRGVIEAGLVYRDGVVWRAREGGTPAAVPESVQGVIQSRVDRLEPALKGVLQQAAVLGRRFRPRVLARLIPAELDLEETLWQLEDEALIYQGEALPEPVYAFKHVLTQAAIYQSLLQRQRAERHQAAAEVMEALYADDLGAHCEALAYHYERSNAAEKAVVYLLQAGEKARRAFLNDDAAAYFKRTLDKLAELPEDEAHLRRRYIALKGLGQVYSVQSNFSEAESCLREAIALGNRLTLPQDELIRLHWWLGDLLMNWGSRFEEAAQVGLAGLALLGEETQSAEAAMMNGLIAVAYECLGNIPGLTNYARRHAPFLLELPYAMELRTAYNALFLACFHREDLDGARRWAALLKERADQGYDLWALAEATLLEASFLAWADGDLPAGMLAYQESGSLFRKLGDRRRVIWTDLSEAWTDLFLGRVVAIERVSRMRADVERFAPNHIPDWHRLLGICHLLQGQLAQAEAVFQAGLTAADRFPSENLVDLDLRLFLGRVCLQQDRRQQAAEHFNAALHRFTGPNVTPVETISKAGAWQWKPRFADALCGLEESVETGADFWAVCEGWLAVHLLTAQTQFRQWSLRPAKPVAGDIAMDFFADKDGAAGSTDPAPRQFLGAGDQIVELEEGVTIYAANGRSLWGMNRSAPRLLRPVRGDFMLQAICSPAQPDRPGIGGLLLWQNRDHFLCLERGEQGSREMRLLGSLARQPVVIGRGWLPLADSIGPVYLRLEWIGQCVRALCSADGSDWFSVGEVEFALDDPLEVGIYAAGMIDRTAYPGAFPEGAAMRFERIRIFQKKMGTAHFIP